MTTESGSESELQLPISGEGTRVWNSKRQNSNNGSPGYEAEPTHWGNRIPSMSRTISFFTFNSFEILCEQVYTAQDNEEYFKLSNLVWAKILRVQISWVQTPKDKQEGEDQGLCFQHTQGLAGIISTYYSVTVASHSLTSARVTHISTHKHPICIVITAFSVCSQPHQPLSSKLNLQIHTNLLLWEFR